MTFKIKTWLNKDLLNLGHPKTYNNKLIILSEIMKLNTKPSRPLEMVSLI